MMKQVPNFITCLNLLSGCMACVMALQGNYLGAFIFIVLAAIFDFLDGFAARLLKAYSDLGKQLDSLSDVVSFGVAPGFILYAFLSSQVEQAGINANVALIGLLIPIFAAIRLAKFNIDTRQTNSFLGLPVPANGLFWTSFIFALSQYGSGYETSFILIIAALIAVFSFLMVSEVPMFSLKFKSYTWKGNEWAYTLIIASIALIALFKIQGISLCITAYIILSIIKNIIERKRTK